MIKTGWTSKTKETGGGGNGGYASQTNITNITNVASATVADRLSKAVDIWGNDFDGSDDVDGDLVLSENQTLRIAGEFDVKSFYNENSGLSFDEAERITDRSKLNINLTDINSESSDVKFHYEDNNSSVEINGRGLFVKGNASLTTPTVITNVLDSTDSQILVKKPLKLLDGLDLTGQDIKVKNIESENINNSEKITTKDLVVSGSAHFFNLIIDEVQHAGGQMILSPGNFHVDKIEYIDATYNVDGSSVLQHNICGDDTAYKVVRLFQIANNENGDVINNTIQANDHVFCWTTNIKLSTLTRNYWTAVLSVGDGVLTEINSQNRYCNYIDIVYSVLYNGEWIAPTYGVVNVKVDDNLAVLGSLNHDRQSAIIMAAYMCPDTEIEAPCIAQYQGINSWNFSGKRTTYFSKNKNRIQGDLYMTGGENVEDILSGITSGETSYIHVAYANSADGSVDFTKNSEDIEAPLYIGFCTDFVESDSHLTYSDYKWSQLRDENEQVIGNKLYPVRERLYLDASSTLWMDFCYDITFWSNQNHSILCTHYRLDGSTNIIQLSRFEQDGRTYMSCTMSLLSGWNLLEESAKYVYATVEMINSQSIVVDKHYIEVSYEASAVLSITDSIEARVSDAEGNISTLTVASDSIKSRVELLEAEVTGQAGESGTVIEKVAELEVEVDAITATVSALTTQLNTINGSLVTVSEEVSQIKQEVDNINISVSEKVYGGTNLLSGTDFNPDNLSELQQFYNKYDENLIMFPAGNIESPNPDYGVLKWVSDSTTQFNSNNYIDLIQWPLNGVLQPNAWYTLSFYMKNSKGGIISYVYAPHLSTNCSGGTEERWIDGVINISAGDNNYTWPVSSEWVKHVYTFKTAASLTNTSGVYLLFRASSIASNAQSGSPYPEMYLTLPKLEYGQVATDYSLSVKDVKSEINVLSGKISLQVTNDLKRTGIDILTGEINLNADNTNIIGNLNLRESDNGLTVFDDAGVARVNIRATEIGEYTSEIKPSVKPFGINGVPSDNAKYYTDLTFARTSIGRFLKNQKITMKFIRLNCSAIEKGTNFLYYPRASSVNVTVKFLNSSGTVVYTGIVNLAGMNPIRIFDTLLGYTYWDSGENYTEWICTVDDDYFVEFSYNFVEPTSIILINLTKLQGNIYAQVSQYVDNQTFIGVDGFYSSPKDNSILWVGRDSIRLQSQNNINSMLVLNDDGVRQCGGFININNGDGTYTRKPLLYSLYNYTPLCLVGEDLNRPILLQYITNLGTSDWSYFINPDKDNGVIMVHAPLINGSVLGGNVYIVLPDIYRQDEDGNGYLLPAGYTVEVWNRTYNGGQSYNNYTNTKVFVCVNEVYNSWTSDAYQSTIIDANRNLNWRIDLNGSDNSKQKFIWTGWYWVCERDV